MSSERSTSTWRYLSKSEMQSCQLVVGFCRHMHCPPLTRAPNKRTVPCWLKSDTEHPVLCKLFLRAEHQNEGSSVKLTLLLCVLCSRCYRFACYKKTERNIRCQEQHASITSTRVSTPKTAATWMCVATVRVSVFGGDKHTDTSSTETTE